MKKSVLFILLIFIILCSACSKAEKNSFEQVLPQGIYSQHIFQANIGYMNQDEGKDVVITFSQLEIDVVMGITFRNSETKNISIHQVLVENDIINDEQNITYNDSILDELSEASTIKGLIVFVTAQGSSTKDIAVTFNFDSEHSNFFSIDDFVEWNENRGIRTIDDWRNPSYDNSATEKSETLSITQAEKIVFDLVGNDDRRNIVQCEQVIFRNDKYYYQIKMYNNVPEKTTVIGWYAVDVFTGEVFDTIFDWVKVEKSHGNNRHQGLYKPVIDSWMLAANEMFDKENDYQKEYPFICKYGQKEYGKVKYAFLDINDDDLSELLIFGGMDYIIDVYTIKNGEPVRAFETTEPRGFSTRHRLYLDEDNRTFKLESSGGASYNDIAFYQVNKHGVAEQTERYSQDGEEKHWHYDASGNKTAIDYNTMVNVYVNTSANEYTKSGIKWKELD